MTQPEVKAAAPLSRLAVLIGEGEVAQAARARLAAAGAVCVTQPGLEGLRQAIAHPGIEAVCWLPPAMLPVRPPAEIAAFLLDGRDHLAAEGQAWCVTLGVAQAMLPRLEAEGAEPGRLAEMAGLAGLAPKPGPAPSQPAGRRLELADLPAAFASGLPFAGPFDGADRLVLQRALAAAEARPSRPGPKALPDGLTPVGPAPAPRSGEILAVIVARDEALRLPAALAHLRRLGVDRTIVIDNESADGTAELARQAGAHLVRAPGSYAASGFGITWTNAVLDAWGRGHWALVVDADELLVYPGSDRVGLHALCDHLDSIGSEALRTILLDCFPPGALSGCTYRPGEDLMRAAPLFEPPALRREAVEDFPYTLDYGGIRERLFFPEADPRRPGRWLHQRLFNLAWRVAPLRRARWFTRLAPAPSPTVTKLPLLRWREGAALLGSTHRVAPMALAESQPSGVLLHYKFLQDFHARAVDAVKRNAHWDGSREYRRYLARLEAEPGFTLASPRSVAYRGPDQLVELGLMADTPGWRAMRDAMEAAGFPHRPA